MSHLGDLPKSKKEARAAEVARYFTGKPCKHGHVAYRYACGGMCSACSDIATLARYHRVKGTPEYKASRRAKAQRQRQRNPEQVAAWLADWKARNAERRQQYRKDRLAYYAERAQARYAGLKTATPTWSEKICIFSLYGIAHRLRAAGVDVQVDHIAPLRGKTVSGLHVRNNLRIIPTIENQRKNRFFEVAA